MAFLKTLTSAFQKFEEMSSKDEIVFGEIVRLMVEAGRPMVYFNASEDKQMARFLLNDPVLYAVRITLDKKIGGISTLSLTAEVRNKLADPDDMIKMFKTDFANFAKIPILGQVKINHEYNTIYATVTSFKQLNSYLGGKTGEVKRDVLEADLNDILSKLTESLKSYKK